VSNRCLRYLQTVHYPIRTIFRDIKKAGEYPAIQGIYSAPFNKNNVATNLATIETSSDL
jgi:hypothetical protein